MKLKSIIAQAFAFTRKHKSVTRVFAFPSALLHTIVGIAMLVYQYQSMVTSDIIAKDHAESFLYKIISAYVNLFDTNTSLGLTVTVVFIVTVVLFFLVPVFSTGALIELIARDKNGEAPLIAKGFTFGFFNFLPLFEYSLIVRSFTLVSVVTEALFILRNFGWDWFYTLLIPIILMAITSLFVTLFLTYTEYYMVIDKQKIFRAMKMSAVLVLRHWQQTLLILILMAIIGVRIAVNVLIVIAIPVLIVSVPTLFLYTSYDVKTGVIVGGILGIISLYIAAYFNAVLETWTKAVWVYSFLELTAEKEVDARGHVVSAEA